MATVINTGVWSHTDMSQSMDVTLSYDETSRSGTGLGITAYVSVYLGGTSSYWGYDMYANFTINGVSSGEIQLRASSPSMQSGDTVSSSYTFSFDVGTSSGSIDASVHVYSKTDTNACGINGQTTSGAISYAATNTAPFAPTSVSPSSGIFGNLISISWSGASDNEGDTLHYELQVSINGVWSTLIPAANGYTSTSYDYDISGHAGGTQYMFGVIAIDTSGAASGPAYSSGYVYKNRSPYATNSVWTSEAFAQSATTVNWNAASDPDGQAVTYVVNIYKDGVYQGNVPVSGTSYVYNFPGDTYPNVSFMFSVITVDTLGFTSSATAGGYCVKKIPSDTPSFVIPVTGGTVYDKRPRIVIKINNDGNGDGQKLYVNWKGIEYNSVDHTSLFSTTGSSLVNTKTIVFKPSVDGDIAANSISIRTHNGYYFSNSASISITIANIPATPIIATETLIVGTYTTEVRNAANTVLQAYGQSSYTFPTNVSKDNFIGLNAMTEIRNKLVELITLLNNYDGNGTFDIPTTWTANDIFINSKYIDEIKTRLTNI